MNPPMTSEEKRPNVPVKVDNQNYSFLLLRYLQRIDPQMHAYVIYDLLIIFFTVDVMLYPRIIDWLKPAHGLESARKIVNQALKSWKSLPLHFEMTKTHGWVVSCRSGSNKDPVIEDEGDETDDDNQDDSEDAFIEEVEAITEDGSVDGYLMSQIREGDSVQLNSHSQIWWTVFEMRPRKKSVMLSRQRSTQGPLLSQDPEDDDSGAMNGRDDELNGEKNKISKKFSTRTITEYKEIRIDGLFGALVRREGVLSARTMETLERENNCNFDHNLMTYVQFEEYSAMLTQTNMSKSKCNIKAPKRGEKKDGDSLEGKDSSLANTKEKKEYEDKWVVVIFKMPLPSVPAAVDRMKELTEEYPILPETKEAYLTNPDKKQVTPAHEAATKDPVWHMQHQAQIKVWVSRWEESLRARQLLEKIDPYLCLHRDKWLLVCKVLRVVSRGGEALLQHFIQWTKKAGSDGLKRSRDALAAWASVRPITTCDLQPLATARAYLRQRGAGHKKSYYDAEGKLRPEAMDTDPQARIVLDAAALYMSHRVLTFFDQSLVAPKPGSETEEDIDGMAATVPSALYKYALKMPDYANVESIPTHHIGTFLEERPVSAFIGVNDCLLVREPLTGQTLANNNSQIWVLVLAVDLLFARLRVVQCDPQVPPPYCWTPECHAPLVNSSPCWISVAKLWDVTVCRQMPPVDPDDTSNGLYTIFITPMPSQHEALAVLGHLSDVDVSGAVTAPTAANGKAKKFKEYVPREALAERAQLNSKEKAEAMMKRAAPGVKSLLTGKAKVTAVRFYVDSVILQWSLTLDRKNVVGLRSDKAGILEKKEVVPEFLIELALTSSPNVWQPVYRGNGSACQISGLEPLTKYYCRLTTTSHPKIGYSCVVVTTLGEPPTLIIPTIKRWEKGSVKGSVRGLCCLESNDLPSGCYLQIEASLGNSKSNGHHAAKEWLPLARTRNTSVWIVGQFAGMSIILRSKVINQDGQPGPPGPTGVTVAPTLRELE